MGAQHGVLASLYCTQALGTQCRQIVSVMCAAGLPPTQARALATAWPQAGASWLPAPSCSSGPATAAPCAACPGGRSKKVDWDKLAQEVKKEEKEEQLDGDAVSIRSRRRCCQKMGGHLAAVPQDLRQGVGSATECFAAGGRLGPVLCPGRTSCRSSGQGSDPGYGSLLLWRRVCGSSFGSFTTGGMRTRGARWSSRCRSLVRAGLGALRQVGAASALLVWCDW